jgi:SGNH hydrolase-like domain, acetyltransferase AlgX
MKRWAHQRAGCGAGNVLPAQLWRWALVSLACAGWVLLLLHRSKSPSILGRYSVEYVVLIVLSGCNVALLCWISFTTGGYQRLLANLAPQRLPISILPLVPVMVLLDFGLAMDPPRGSRIWATVALVAGMLIQVRAIDARVYGNIVVAISSLAIGVLLLEVVVVYVLAERHTPRTQAEFRRLMSSLGRERAPMPKPVNTLRILGLADSFGEHGGEANYHYQLEEMLRRDVSSGIDLVNVSLEGYEPRHELELLKFAMVYAPDIVLHGFFVGNDFSLATHDRYEIAGVSVVRYRDASPYRPGHFLLRGWGTNLFMLFDEQRRRRRELKEGLVQELGVYSASTFRRIQYDRLKTWGKRSTEPLAQMRQIFPVVDAIRATAEGGGARYVMVMHPDRTQVSLELAREIFAHFDVDPARYDLDQPQELLRSYCKQHDITCIDLLPVFRKNGLGESGYRLRDTHYNIRGNQVAAAAIADALKRQLLARRSGEAARDFR